MMRATINQRSIRRSTNDDDNDDQPTSRESQRAIIISNGMVNRPRASPMNQQSAVDAGRAAPIVQKPEMNNQRYTSKVVPPILQGRGVCRHFRS